MTEAAATETDTHAPTLATLSRALGGATLTTTRFRDNLRVHLRVDQLIASLASLKDESGFRLMELGGVDYLGYPGNREGKCRFEVHYCLLNPDTHERIVLKVGVDDPNPTIPSAVPLWMGADWMEREVFDMYGIKF